VRIEGKEMRRARRGHCPHRNRHNEVGDSKKAQTYAALWRQPPFAPTNAATTTAKQRTAREASVPPKHEENAPPTRLSECHDKEGIARRGLRSGSPRNNKGRSPTMLRPEAG